MKTNSKDQEAIVALLNEIYLEVVDIETRFKLSAGAGDMRPRIDYFHDAIRAFSSEGKHHPRLSIELLSYDLRCLRYIGRLPLAPFRGNEKLSPSQDIITTESDLMATGNRPDRKIRTRISELYQHYSVMFAALLKPAADYDYQERTETLDNDVRDIQAIVQKFENDIDVNMIAQLSQNLEEGELRIILMTFLQQKRQKNKDDVKKLLGHLKNHIKQKDAMIKAIDKAHLGFATAQLGIFEESKE
ncbi:MAG: hypothetical protein ABL857_04195, partial [Rickettsiales bacterium]